MRPAAILALALGVGAGCGAPGQLLHVERDLRFVREPAELYVAEPDGLHRLRLDGTGDRLVFRGQSGVKDVTDDLRQVAMTDAATNLLLGDLRTGLVRSVPALAGRASGMAFSPDGRTLAVSRHADFSLPQDDWRDDDTIYLVDVETLAVTTVPPATAGWPNALRFSADGTAVELTMAFGQPPAWLTIGDRVRHRGRYPGALRAPSPPESRCPARIPRPPSGATAMQIVEPGQPPRTLVAEVGRRRGFHDYAGDFPTAAFSPACQHVVFRFQGALWVVEIASGRVGRLADGHALFFATP